MPLIGLMASCSGVALLLALWHAIDCAMTVLAGRRVGAIGVLWALPAVAALQLAGAWGSAVGPGAADLALAALVAGGLVLAGVLDWQEGVLLGELSTAVTRPDLMASTGVSGWQLALAIGGLALVLNLVVTALSAGLATGGIRGVTSWSLSGAAESTAVTTAIASLAVIAHAQLLGRSLGVIAMGLAVVAVEWVLQVTGARQFLRWPLYPLGVVGLYYAWLTDQWLPLTVTIAGARFTLWAAGRLHGLAAALGAAPGRGTTPRVLPAALVVSTVVAASFSGIVVTLLGLMG